MSIALHHVAINVADPAKTACYYAVATGFSDVSAEGARWIAGANAFVALHPTTGTGTGEKRVCDPGIAHFCVQAGDGDWLWGRMADAGMDFISRPVALGTGNVYAYGRDPDRNLVEVEGVPNADPQTPIWLAHVALCTPDIEASKDFYTRLIGHAPHRTGHFANPLFPQLTGFERVEVEAAWFSTGGLQVEIWQYLEPQTGAPVPRVVDAPGYRHMGFVVADLEAAAVALRARGILLEAGEAVGGLPALWTTDPDGNRIAVFVVPEESALAFSRLSDPGVVQRRLARAA